MRKAWFIVQHNGLKPVYSIIYDDLPSEPPMSGKLPAGMLVVLLSEKAQTFPLSELSYRYENGYSFDIDITWKVYPGGKVVAEVMDGA